MDIAEGGSRGSVQWDGVHDYEVLELTRSWEFEEGDIPTQIVDVQGIYVGLSGM